VDEPALGEPPLGEPAVRVTAGSIQPVSRTLPSASVQVRKERRSDVGAADQGLRAEMTILQQASAALDRGELAQARSLLKTHRAQYPQGQLSEEQQGLEALTRCMAGDAGAQPSAQRSAQRYLKSAPQGVLAARVARACLMPVPSQGPQ
jgi:outer membrane protein assembly factor BamD (BamD/ComL family)